MTRHPWRWLLFTSLAASGCWPSRRPSLVPEMSVDMEQHQLHDFYEEIQEYVRLRQDIVAQVPAVPADGTAEQVGARQKAMTEAIVAHRRKARQGEIFKPDIATAFRRIIARELTGPDAAAMLNELRSGNPKVEGVPKVSDPTHEVKTPVTLRVNARYPESASFSSVPPSLLRKLPQLPDQVRYRFVGRTLILRDTDANVILDYIPDVVPDPSIPR